MTRYELPPEALELIQQVTDLERRAATAQNALNRAAARLNEDRAQFERLVKTPAAGFELVAEAWADWERARSDRTAAELLLKPPAATSAAETVREKGRELALLRRQAKLAEYIVALYERHFPWLVELRDQELEAAYVKDDDGSEEGQDPARRWVSQEEWEALSPADRNQRALDRYLKSQKSAWQLGRDYERFVGYLREQDGYSVTYHGIEKRFADLGRDLLAERDGTIEVIQCKRWAQHKTIHEAHIFQLYGTVVLARLENPEKSVTGTFTTTTSLSDVARRVAEHLDIKLEEQTPLEDYPRIKCNVAPRGGERIYHLPFDQQYDNVIIEPDRGERYVSRVAEAEAAGFRRAWRWHGEADASSG